MANLQLGDPISPQASKRLLNFDNERSTTGPHATVHSTEEQQVSSYMRLITPLHYGPPLSPKPDASQYTSPKLLRKTKGHVASSCVPCKRAHLRCDAQRPCSRCSANGKEDACIDVQHKKRGRPRLRDERENRFAEGAQIDPQQPDHPMPYSVYKSQNMSTAMSPRYLEHGTATYSTMDHGQMHPTQKVPVQQAPVCAYMNMNFKMLSASRTFCDAVGISNVLGRRLYGLVALGHREIIDDLQKSIQDERAETEPFYKPDDNFGGYEEDRVIQSFELSFDQIARVRTERKAFLSFQGSDGYLRYHEIRMGLAKKDTIYFVALELVSRSAPTEFQLKFSPPVEHGYQGLPTTSDQPSSASHGVQYRPHRSDSNEYEPQTTTHLSPILDRHQVPTSSGSGQREFFPHVDNSRAFQSPSSSETMVATDTSLDDEVIAELSDIETDWEEIGNVRDNISGEICALNLARRLTTAEVKQQRNEGLAQDPQRQKLIDSLMKEFYAIFGRSNGNYINCGEGDESSRNNNSQRPVSSLKGKSSTAPGGNRRRIDLSGIPEEEDGDLPGERFIPQQKSNEISGSPKFACPYHQHDPERYGMNLRTNNIEFRSCAGPGWMSVARIKEHLYRRHRIPLRCIRCNRKFSHQNHLDNHLRNRNLCELLPEEAVEGITADTEKQLKSRKRTAPDQSEEDKWRQIYQILFPNEDIPSPYYEPSDGVARFEEYSRQETPRIVLALFQNRASMNLLTEETRNDIVNIVQESRRAVYREYRLSNGRERTTTTPSTLFNSEPQTSPPNIRNATYGRNDRGYQDGEASNLALLDFNVSHQNPFDPYEFQQIFDGAFDDGNIDGIMNSSF